MKQWSLGALYVDKVIQNQQIKKVSAMEQACLRSRHSLHAGLAQVKIFRLNPPNKRIEKKTTRHNGVLTHPITPHNGS